MVIGHQTQSARESKTPAQKARQSSHIGSGVPAQRTEAAVTLQLARTAPASLQPADVLALQRAGGNQAVQRLLAPALARLAQGVPAVQLKPQATGAGVRVTPAPAGVIQRVSKEIKQHNVEVFKQEVRQAISDNLKEYSSEQQDVLFKQLLEHPSLFPPPDSSLYNQLYDHDEKTFGEGKLRRQIDLMFPIFENEDLIKKMLSAEVKKEEWRKAYAKQRRAPIDQSQVLSAYYKGEKGEVGGICFAASIHWLSQVKKNPKYKAEDAVKFITSKSGLEKLLEIQKAHYQFTEQQQSKVLGLGSPVGLPKQELEKLKLEGTEEINYHGTLDNLDPFFDFMKEKGRGLTKDQPHFRFILSLQPKEKGTVGHAIGFQLRRKGRAKMLQVNFLDVNETVFKMKKIPLPLDSEAGQGAWAELKTAVKEYLTRYPLLPNWSLVSYK